MARPDDGAETANVEASKLAGQILKKDVSTPKSNYAVKSMQDSIVRRFRCAKEGVWRQGAREQLSKRKVFDVPAQGLFNL